MTLQSLFGSESSAGVLAFLARFGQGYASEIARYINMDLYAVQKQLAKFESTNLLESRPATNGRARVFRFNSKHPLQGEIKILVEKAASLENHWEKRNSSSAPLPEDLRIIFWDYRLDDLSWEADRELVIRRVLTGGSWDAIAWLRRKLGDADLRKWLIDHRGRGLSPRQLRFWSLILGLPRQIADAWVDTARLTPFHQ